MPVNRLLLFAISLQLLTLHCTVTTAYDVLIIGGSYSGLSAALSLGRSCRSVLVADSGVPCNEAQPASHNFLTRDGEEPREISQQAFESVAKYPTVDFCTEAVVGAQRQDATFCIETASGQTYKGRSLIIATGMIDQLPSISGVSECWGRSLIHCPYCHGYEFKDCPTTLWMTAANVMKMAPIIRGLTNDLTVITSLSDFEVEHIEQLASHGIRLVDDTIVEIKHDQGLAHTAVLASGKELRTVAIYVRPALIQALPWKEWFPGLEMQNGYIEVDDNQQTKIEGIFACGDCTTTNRAISIAVASGTKAAKMLSYQLAMKDWVI